MNLINLFKFKELEGNHFSSVQYGGIIKQLGLEEFWGILSDEEKNNVRIGCKRSFGISHFQLKDVDRIGSGLTTRRQTSSFLIGVAAWVIEMEKYVLAEKLLLKAIELAQNISTVHISYNWLIRIHNILRFSRQQSLNECIMYCKSDIELYPLLLDEFQRENINYPGFNAFKVLISIYNDLELIEEELEVKKLENLYRVF